MRMAITALILAAILKGALLVAAEPERPPVVELVSRARPHALPNAQAVAFSPDGQYVAAGFGAPPAVSRFPLEPGEGKIVVWEFESGAVVRTIPTYGDIVRVQFTADNQELLYSRVYTPGDSVDDDATVLVALTTGETRWKWPQPIFAASSSLIALGLRPAAGSDQVFDVARLDFGLDERRATFPDGYAARQLEFSGDGRLIAAAHGILESMPGDGPRLLLQGRSRVVRQRTLTLYDADTLKPLRSGRSDLLEQSAALDVTAAGERLVIGAAGSYEIWEGRPLRPRRRCGLGGCNSPVLPRFSPDGRWLAVLSQPSRGPRDPAAAPGPCLLHVVETATIWPRLIVEIQDGAFDRVHAGRSLLSLNPRRLAFSPDGHHLLVGCHGVSLIDLETGFVARQFEWPPPK